MERILRENVLVSSTLTDYNYLNALGLELAEGREFMEEFPGDFAGDSTGNFIINEELRRLMGVESAVGKRFSFLRY